jgi:hypothetical protein
VPPKRNLCPGVSLVVSTIKLESALREEVQLHRPVSLVFREMQSTNLDIRQARHTGHYAFEPEEF